MIMVNSELVELSCTLRSAEHRFERPTLPSRLQDPNIHKKLTKNSLAIAGLFLILNFVLNRQTENIHRILGIDIKQDELALDMSHLSFALLRQKLSR